MYPRRQPARKPRTPAGGSPAPTPAQRKKIVDMSAPEFERWAQERITGLSAFVREAQRYRAGRNWPGNETNRTNIIYDEFLREAADLLEALEEMRAAAERNAQQP